MQGSLVAPPDLRPPDDPEGRRLHREALTVPEALADAAFREDCARMREMDISYWLPGDARLARRLGPDAPALLFVRGRPDLSAPAVAVVGTRRPDRYGIEVATRLAGTLARERVTVVSGGAVGIDAAAHRGALDAGGATIVVLGGGMAEPHPPANRDLFERAVRAGSCVVSEYAPGTPAGRHRFPERNRIVAALADAVVVVQAGIPSGAAITAERAARLGIPVFAVPGDVWYERSAGTLRLIGRGARVLARPSDLAVVPALRGLSDLDWPVPGRRLPGTPVPWMAGPRLPARAPGEEAGTDAVLAALEEGAASLDDLCDRMGLGPGPLSAMLLRLEVEGRVVRLGGGLFGCP